MKSVKRNICKALSAMLVLTLVMPLFSASGGGMQAVSAQETDGNGCDVKLIVDELTDWSKIYDYSDGWTQAGDLLRFGDESTIHPGSGPEYVTYYSEQGISSIDLKLFGADGGSGTLDVQIYVSPDEAEWQAVPVNRSLPVPSPADDYWASATVTAARLHTYDAKYVKVELPGAGWKTQIGSVQIKLFDADDDGEEPEMTRFVDELDNWDRVYAHSSGWTQAGDLVRFNDASTVHPGSSAEYLIYYDECGISEMDMRLFGADGGAGSLEAKVYVSDNGEEWTEALLDLKESLLSEADPYWAIATLTTRSPFVSGTTYMKIEIPGVGWKTQIGSVSYMPGDSGIGPDYNFALYKEVAASSGFTPRAAVDNDASTGWISDAEDRQWIMIDLGEPRNLSRIELHWGNAYGKAYTIEGSTDGELWETVHTEENGAGGIESIAWQGTAARYVRLNGSRSDTSKRYIVNEFKVFGAISSSGEETAADESAPGMTVQVLPAASAAGKAAGDVRIWFRASEPVGESGVKAIYYEASGHVRIPKQKIPVDSDYISLASEGRTEITYYAVDYAGNTSETGRLTVGAEHAGHLVEAITAAASNDWIADQAAERQLSGKAQEIAKAAAANSAMLDNKVVLEKLQSFASVVASLLGEQRIDANTAAILQGSAAALAKMYSVKTIDFVNADTISYPWIGFGINHDPLNRDETTQGDQNIPWTDEKFEMTAERLEFIRPSMVRLVIDERWIVEGTDSNGDGYKDPLPGAAVNYDSPEMASVLKWLDYYRERNIPVITGLWHDFSHMRLGTEEFAAFHADLFQYLIQEKGYSNIQSIFLINELNYYTDIDTYRRAMEYSIEAFEARGLDTGLLVSSDAGGVAQAEQFLGDTARMQRSTAEPGYLVWQYDDISQFKATVHEWPSLASDHYMFEVSADGLNWSSVPVTFTPLVSFNPRTAWFAAEVAPQQSLPSGTSYLRITLQDSVDSWNPQLGRVEFSYGGDQHAADELDDWSKLHSYSPNMRQDADFTMTTAEEMKDTVKAYEFHQYGDAQMYPYVEQYLRLLNEKLRTLDADTSKPYFLGEHGMADMDWPAPGEGIYSYDWGINIADYNVMVARSGMSGALAWALDGYDMNKQAGMWDKRGLNGYGYSLRPWFYTYALMSRYMPAGAEIVVPAEPDPNVHVTGARIGKDWTFAFVNRNESGRAIAFELPKELRSATLSIYRVGKGNTADTADVLTDEKGFPVPIETMSAKGLERLTVMVPADGMVLVTSLDSTGNPVDPGTDGEEPSGSGSSGPPGTTEGNAEDGPIVHELKDHDSAVVIKLDDIGSRTRRIVGDGFQIDMPASALEELKRQAEAAGSVEIVLRIAPAAAYDAPNEKFRLASGVYYISFALRMGDGSERPAAKSDTTFLVHLHGTTEKKESFTGLYRYDEQTGRWIFVSDRKQAASASSDGKQGSEFESLMETGVYAALEYIGSFSDVPSAHWASPAVQELAAKGIVNGKTADKFAPGDKISRAEFVALLLRVLGMSSDSLTGVTDASPFADVAVNAWYAQDIAVAYEHGLVQGKSSNVFGPDDSITREQMAVLLVKALELRSGGSIPAGSSLDVFKDSERISGWAREALSKAIQAGLLRGDGSALRPKADATRAEAAQVIYNFMQTL